MLKAVVALQRLAVRLIRCGCGIVLLVLKEHDDFAPLKFDGIFDGIDAS